MNDKTKKILIYGGIGAAVLAVVCLIAINTTLFNKIKQMLHLQQHLDNQTEEEVPTAQRFEAVDPVSGLPNAQREDYPLRKNLSKKWADVYYLQTVLKNNDMLYGAHDGVWGPLTEKGMLDIRTAIDPITNTRPLEKYISLDATGSAYIKSVEDYNAIVNWSNAYVQS